jgi:hypothetical protein
MILKKSKKTICYHGRCGKPFIHEDAKGKRFIMVRKKGGGTKRLYEGSTYYERKVCKVRDYKKTCRFTKKKKLKLR